jgi:hypothetical protein
MMTAAAIDRSLNGKHTFSCALSTRGAACDCWPEPVGSTPSDLSIDADAASSTESIEHCAICGRSVGRTSDTIVDVDGSAQLCERCFVQAENAQRADTVHVVDL